LDRYPNDKAGASSWASIPQVIYVEAEGGIDLPLDFDPEEAEEIAEELRAAAEAARAMGDRSAPKPKKR
jgi:ArsR family metal-binding transcriptional regulator